MYRVISIVLGYFIGCFQTAFILGKTKEHIDIREYGSGNSGTTNAIRVMGWKMGILTFFGDFLKALIAVLVATHYFQNPIAGLYAGIGVVVGHDWPVFLKFKGGKGIASTIGLLYGIDWRVGLIVTIIMASIIGISKYVSLGSVFMAISIPILLFIFVGRMEFVIGGALLTAIALYRHKSNIGRLLSGTENKLGHKK